ncbi:MAG: hypothetical protein OHK0017_05020 [Patescibacteria group bacterium]
MSFQKQFQPDYFVFAKDLPKPTFRDQMFDQYKAGRMPTPPEMVIQIPLLNQWLETCGANVMQIEGYEADDMIASFCHNNPEHEILIFSGDRDLYQLLALPHVKMLLSDKFGGIRTFGADDFQQKYILQPDQWLDYKALVGDSSDNIKGVTGVGPKTATDLLCKFGSLEAVFQQLQVDFPSLLGNFSYFKPTTSAIDNTAKIPEKIALKLKNDLHDVVLAYQLSQLANPDHLLELKQLQLHQSIQLLQEWEFKSILKDLQPVQINIEQIEQIQTSLF